MCFFIEILSVFWRFEDNDTEFVFCSIMQHFSLPLIQIHQGSHFFFVYHRFILKIHCEDLDLISECLKLWVIVREYHFINERRLNSIINLTRLA